MAQQVSAEAAAGVFRQECGRLHDENLLLKARIAELEEELTRRPPLPVAQSLVQNGLGAAPAEQAPDGDHAHFDQQNHLER